MSIVSRWDKFYVRKKFHGDNIPVGVGIPVFEEFVVKFETDDLEIVVFVVEELVTQNVTE